MSLPQHGLPVAADPQRCHCPSTGHPWSQSLRDVPGWEAAGLSILPTFCLPVGWSLFWPVLDMDSSITRAFKHCQLDANDTKLCNLNPVPYSHLPKNERLSTSRVVTKDLEEPWKLWQTFYLSDNIWASKTVNKNLPNTYIPYDVWLLCCFI